MADIDFPNAQPPFSGEQQKYVKDLLAVVKQLSRDADQTNSAVRRVGAVAQGASSLATDAARETGRVERAGVTDPAAPVGVSAISSAYWDKVGAPKARATVTWDQVVNYYTGEPLGAESPITLYQVWAFPNDSTKAKLLGTVAPVGNVTPGAPTAPPPLSLVIDDLSAATAYEFAVRARTKQGSWGDCSTSITHTTAGMLQVPAAPSTPTATSDLGVVTVRWDGLFAGGSTPPGFLRVQGEWRVGAGTWKPLGEATIAGIVGQVTGQVAGASVQVRLRSVNAAGIESALSAVATVTVTGIELPDVGTSIQNAIQDAIDGAADAQSTANTAITAANNRNQMFHSTANASGTARAGDIWHKWSTLGVGGVLLATWRSNGGTDWVQMALDPTYIPLLDIGAGTFGSLNGDRLKANTVTSKQALIGDFTNLFNSPYLDGGTAEVGIAGATAYTGTEVSPRGGRIFSIASRDHAALDGYRARAKQGEEFYIEVVAKRITGALALTLKVGQYGLDGNDSPGSPYWSTVVTRATSLVEDLGDGWGRYSATGKWNSAATSAAFVGMYLTINQGIPPGTPPNGDTTWLVTDPVLRRMNAGELIVDGAITAAKLSATEIWANTAWLDQATINILKAGSVQAQHLAIGARPAQGEAQQRVPAPLTDADYWGKVVAGTIPLSPISRLRTTATASGLVINGSGGNGSIGITGVNPVPISRKVHVTFIQSSPGAQARVRWYSAAGATLTDDVTATGAIAVAPALATDYTVYLLVPSGSTTTTVVAARVFEVTATGVTGEQSVEISPSGLKLTSETGAGVIDLTTSSDNFISIMKDTGLGYEAQATIDSAGRAVFQNATVNTDVTVRGTPLLGTFEDLLRNGSPDDGPIFDRAARGAVLTGYYNTVANGSYTDAYRTAAVMQFNVAAGRQYKLDIDDMNYNYNGGTGTGTITCEVLLSRNPIAVNATTGYIVLTESILSVGVPGFSPFQVNRIMGVGSSVTTTQFYSGLNYIMLRWRLTTGASMFVNRGTGSPSTVSITDVGPLIGAGVDYTSAVVSGTPTPPATWKTVQFASNWSASYNNSGANKVTGSGQYDNANYLYQGYGASPMGSWFGFPALGLSGKTISSARLFMQNLHTDSSGGITAILGSHGYASAPASISGTGGNVSYVGFGRGAGAWVTLGSWSYAALAAGTIRGFTLGVDGGAYGYWAGGASSNSRPVLEITYK